MPEFQNDPEHDAWKEGVMSGAIQLEEIDTEAFKDRYGKLAVKRRAGREGRGGIELADVGGEAQWAGDRCRPVRCAVRCLSSIRQPPP